MKKHSIVLLTLVVVLGLVLRFWHLGQVPPSLDWDEASLGWNAYSLLKTGTDEYGVSTPLTIRSFNDYKPPVYVYGLTLVLYFLGLSDFSIRFLSALAGSLSVLGVYFLVRELVQIGRRDNSATSLPLLAASLLAVSPWSVGFSRIAFEANLAQFFIISGALWLLVFLRKQAFWQLFLALGSYLVAFYCYHSSRLFVPLFLVSSALCLPLLSKIRKLLLVGLVIFVLFLLPAFKSVITGDGTAARFGSVSIFAPEAYKEQKALQEKSYQEAKSQSDLIGSLKNHRSTFFPRQFLANYLSYFDFRFLFLQADDNNRHHAPDVGLLPLWEAPFLILGLFFLVSKRPAWKRFLLIWFLAAPVAGALASPSPHAIRSFVFLPTWQIITAFGLLSIIQILLGWKRKLLVMAIACLAIVNIYYFAHQYFIHAPKEYATDFQYGYKQTVQAVKPLEPNYKEIFVTNYYDQPYIYFLLYGGSDPTVKNDGTLGEKYGKIRFFNFRNLNSEEKRQLPKDALFVVAPGDETALSVVKVIVRSQDGRPLFIVGEQITDLGWGSSL